MLVASLSLSPSKSRCGIHVIYVSDMTPSFSEPFFSLPPFRLGFISKALNLIQFWKKRRKNSSSEHWTIKEEEEEEETTTTTTTTTKKMSFLKRVSSFTSFTSFTSWGGGGGGGGRFARRRLTTDGSKEKKSLGVLRSINYTNLLLVTKETALAKYASLFAEGAPGEHFEDNEEDKKGRSSSKVRWDRLKVRHDAHENAVAKGVRF